MGYLVLDSILCMLLAWYLENVLPKEFGVSRSPCFCFTDGYRLIKRLTGSGDPIKDSLLDSQVEPDATTQNATDYKALVSVAEDDDVQAERRRMLTNEIPADSSIKIHGLRKVYPGGFVAVEDLSCHMENGECFGLLGPNGAGKTTSISMLTGLFGPTGGTAQLCGFDLKTQLPNIYRVMGICPQFDICWPNLTVQEHLLCYARLKGLDKSQELQKVDEMITDVGLAAAKHKMSKDLSGGMRRRLSLAISLVGNPRVVFLDEPTTGLDPETKRNVWALIDRAKQGRCIVLTTHSMEEADALCGRIGIMSHGLLRCLGTNNHLKNKYGNGYKIDVRFKEGMDDAAHQFMMGILPEAKVEVGSSFAGMRVYQVARQHCKLSQVFQAMQTRPESAGIDDYGVRQTSLEEVFLKIARESEAAFAAGGK